MRVPTTTQNYKTQDGIMVISVKIINEYIRIGVIHHIVMIPFIYYYVFCKQRRFLALF